MGASKALGAGMKPFAPKHRALANKATGDELAAAESKPENKGLTDDELDRLRRILRAFPDDKSADQAVELFRTYQSLEHLGKIMLAILKIIAVTSAGVIAWLQLRGLWWGKGG